MVGLKLFEVDKLVHVQFEKKKWNTIFPLIRPLTIRFKPEKVTSLKWLNCDTISQQNPPPPNLQTCLPSSGNCIPVAWLTGLSCMLQGSSFPTKIPPSAPPSCLPPTRSHSYTKYFWPREDIWCDNSNAGMPEPRATASSFLLTDTLRGSRPLPEELASCFHSSPGRFCPLASVSSQCQCSRQPGTEPADVVHFLIS